MTENVKIILPYILVIILSYMLGSFSPSYIISRFKKVNLKKIGTKNLGMSNATVVFGWRLGILVGFLDIFKGFLAVFLTKIFAPQLPSIYYVAAAFVILGHMFPFYLKFDGGKGFATYIGAILGLDWKFAILLAIIIVAVSLITDYIVMGTFTTISSFPLYVFFSTGEICSSALMAMVSFVILFKHEENIRRIRLGTEANIRPMFNKEHRKMANEKLKELAAEDGVDFNVN